MLAKRRIVTAAALLLHSIFGCGLHDACGCAMESSVAAGYLGGIECCAAVPDAYHHHERSEKADTERVADHDQGGHGHCCGIDRSDCPKDQDDARIDVQFSCDQKPCENHGQSGHCGVACSFVPSTDASFQFDAPLIEFVGHGHDPLTSQRNTIRALEHRLSVSIDARGSGCAFRCTWQL